MSISEAIGPFVNEAIRRFEAQKRKATAAKAATVPKATAASMPVTTPLPKPRGPQCLADAVRYIVLRDKCTAAEAGRKALKEWPGLHPLNSRRAR